MKALGLWLSGLLSGLLCGLFEGEARSLIAHLSEVVVRNAALKIPKKCRDRILSECLADLDYLRQQGRYPSMLWHAFQFYIKAWDTAWACVPLLSGVQTAELAVDYVTWCHKQSKQCLIATIPLTILSIISIISFFMDGYIPVSLPLNLLSLWLLSWCFLYHVRGQQLLRSVKPLLALCKEFAEQIEQAETNIEESECLVEALKAHKDSL